MPRRSSQSTKRTARRPRTATKRSHLREKTTPASTSRPRSSLWSRSATGSSSGSKAITPSPSPSWRAATANWKGTKTALKSLTDYRIILASQSPRRREILSRTGLSFEIFPASDKEFTEETDPSRIVEALASHQAREVFQKVRKARAEACSFAEASPVACGTAPKPFFVIGADTIVVCDQKILGKPEDEADAAEMLRLLSGRSHEVMTGVCLIEETPAAGNEETEGGFRERIFHEVTKVRFRTLTEEEIQSYIATGEPMDKAGAYGIQGGAGIFVKALEGEYNNVVGFPLDRILKEIDAFLGAETVADARPGAGERGEESDASVL
ncbi:MAG: septum formation protein Maf [Lachnospiraceae bacterium]|nr:septum formation protein Maf [Lachnospiraceae bacterium]